MADQAPLASIPGWTNFLRKLWSIAPDKLVTAEAIVVMTRNQLAMLRATRQKIRDQDLFWAELSQRSWDNKYAELQAKMDNWVSAMSKDPTDAVATLIVPQIIYAVGTGGASAKGFKLPYIAEVIQLYNQVVTQFEWTGHHVLTGGNLGWIVDTLQEGSHEVFGKSAPGEDPTVRDKVGGAIDDAKNNLDQFWQWAKKATKVGLIALLALAGLYVVTRPKPLHIRATTE